MNPRAWAQTVWKPDSRRQLARLVLGQELQETPKPSTPEPQASPHRPEPRPKPGTLSRVWLGFGVPAKDALELQGTGVFRNSSGLEFRV